MQFSLLNEIIKKTIRNNRGFVIFKVGPTATGQVYCGFNDQSRVLTQSNASYKKTGSLTSYCMMLHGFYNIPT